MFRRRRPEKLSLEDWHREHVADLEAGGMTVILTEATRPEQSLTGTALLLVADRRQGHVIAWEDGHVEVLVIDRVEKTPLRSGTSPPRAGEPTAALLAAFVELVAG